MHTDAYGAFLIVVFNLTFWFFTLFRKSLSPLAKSYFGWSFFITTWAFGYGITLGGIFDYDTTLIWNKYCQAMAMLIGPFFFRFGCVAINRFDKINKRFFKFYLVFGIINAIALFLTPYYVKGLWSFAEYPYQPLGGRLYIIFTLFFMLCTVHSYLVVARHFRSSSGIQRKQVTLFLWATGIAYFGGVTLFLQGYHIPLPTTGVYLILGYVIIIAYAVFRYKFMDIEVIIRKTLVFTGIVGAAACAIALPLGLIQLIVGRAIGISPIWLMVSGVITTALIYRPLERHLVNLTDRFLFQKKYDYRKLLKDAAAGISQIKSLNQLLSLIVHFVTIRVRVKNAAAILYDDKDRSFKFAHPRGYPSGGWLKTGHIFSEHDPLIDYLKQERQSLDIEQVKEYVETGGPKKNKGRITRRYDYELIKVRMDELSAHCCIPSFLGDRLLGVFLLGEKKSGDPYSDEDLAVLFTIAQESAIAIENARLYDRAIEKAKELALINDQLNSAQTKVLQALSEAESANKKLKQTQAELIEAKKRALLAGISSAVGHEIRNPLTPMTGQLYFILKSLDDANGLYEPLAPKLSEAERERFLTLISTLNKRFSGVQRGADRIKGVVNTLINLVKERTDQKSEVQLKLVIASAIEEVRFQTYWESLTIPQIVMDIPADLPFIKGITQDLQGVFVNLIINSLHAMEKTLDKQITIKATLDPDNSKMIKIDFTDNGCGIPRELHEKIFEHGFTTKGTKGTGIGLFYCKDNIERVHGGMISIRSEVNRGTCFTMRLPIYDGSDAAGASGAMSASGR